MFEPLSEKGNPASFRDGYSHAGRQLLFAAKMRTGQRPVPPRIIQSAVELGAPEAQVVVAVAWLVPVAISRTHVASVVVPTAATNHALGAFGGVALIDIDEFKTTKLLDSRLRGNDENTGVLRRLLKAELHLRSLSMQSLPPRAGVGE